MSIREALEKLNDLVDESDPDLDLPNIIHAFQTAERARIEFPQHDWLHLTGLIHDLGKIMAFYGKNGKILRKGMNKNFSSHRHRTIRCCWRYIRRWMCMA